MKRAFGDSFFFIALMDCISFAGMRGCDLEEAITGDHHFEQAGFKVLLKQVD